MLLKVICLNYEIYFPPLDIFTDISTIDLYPICSEVQMHNYAVTDKSPGTCMSF